MDTHGLCFGGLAQHKTDEIIYAGTRKLFCGNSLTCSSIVGKLIKLNVCRNNTHLCTFSLAPFFVRQREEGERTKIYTNLITHFRQQNFGQI